MAFAPDMRGTERGPGGYFTPSLLGARSATAASAAHPHVVADRCAVRHACSERMTDYRLQASLWPRENHVP
jgi:hypothetical protein